MGRAIVSPDVLSGGALIPCQAKAVSGGLISLWGPYKGQRSTSLRILTPVGNGQHGLVGEAFADGLLEQLVCLLVHTCCGLVNAQDLDSRQQGGEATGETGTYPQFPPSALP